jgi:hypothetical protein
VSDFLADLAEKCKPSHLVQYIKVHKESLRKFLIEVKLMRGVVKNVRKTVGDAIAKAPKPGDYGSIHDYYRDAAEHWRTAMIVANTQLAFLPAKEEKKEESAPDSQ